MDRRFKIFLLIPAAMICLLLLAAVGYVGYGIVFRTHPAPVFAIGNNFDQPVIVYIEGRKMGKVNPGDSEKFYPNEVITLSTEKELSLEVKSNSGEILYSRLFATYDEALENLAFGRTYWVGEGK
jgi:hypothetical protein